MIVVIAILLFIVAVAVVKLALKEKAKNNRPTWFLLQMAGSGIGLVSFFLFAQLVGLIG